MVNPEPGRSSSSPNVRITSLQYQGADGSVVQLRLDDGSLFICDADSSALRRLSGPAAESSGGGDGLQNLPGVDEGLLQELRQADEAFRCRRKALDLLARAEQYRRGLEGKLKKKGFSPGAVEAALNRLEAAGLLDDNRFAEAWVRGRLRTRPEGPSKLKGALMAKGIRGTTAGEAVDQVLRDLDDEGADDALERAASKLARRSGMTEEKLLAGLIRRGFPASKVRRFLADESSSSRF